MWKVDGKQIEFAKLNPSIYYNVGVIENSENEKIINT